MAKEKKIVEEKPAEQKKTVVPAEKKIPEKKVAEPRQNRAEVLKEKIAEKDRQIKRTTDRQARFVDATQKTIDKLNVKKDEFSKKLEKLEKK